MKGRTSRGGSDVDADDKDAVRTANAKKRDSRLFILAMVAESTLLRIGRFRSTSAPASQLRIVEAAIRASLRPPGGAAESASKLAMRSARIEDLDARGLQGADLRFGERRHLAAGFWPSALRPPTIRGERDGIR